MTDHTQSRDIKDTVLTRRFELDDRNVDLYVWPSEPAKHDNVSCDFQIIGLGDDKISKMYGVDSIQAISLAIQVAASKLYGSEAWLEGRLTWLGLRDLGLPCNIWERPEEAGQQPARILHAGTLQAVIQLPDAPMPYIAWSKDHLEMYVDGLSELFVEVESSDETARSRAAFLVKTMREQKRYYEEVCHGDTQASADKIST